MKEDIYSVKAAKKFLADYKIINGEEPSPDVAFCFAWNRMLGIASEAHAKTCLKRGKNGRCHDIEHFSNRGTHNCDLICNYVKAFHIEMER